MTSYDVMTCHYVTSKQHDEKIIRIIELIPVAETNWLRIICLLGRSRRDKTRNEAGASSTCIVWCINASWSK